jgi:hypothetical protein
VLQGWQNLCATLSTAQTDGLQEGAQAIAYFNADRIILAGFYIAKAKRTLRNLQ